MKKIIFVICIITLIVLCVSCVGKENENINNISYTMNLVLEDNTIEGQQIVSIHNTYIEGLDKVVFNLYANAYSEKTVDKAYTGKLTKYGGIEINAAKVDGIACKNYTLSENGQILTVPIPALALEKSVEIMLEYTVTIPESNLRLGIKNNSYNLANFYPQVAVFEGGKFRQDRFTTIGDPMFSEVANYEVTLTANKEMIFATSAKLISENVSGKLKTVLYKGTDIRDFAMAANKDFKTVQGKYNDTVVTYYYTVDNNSAATLDYALSALKTFSESFGAYPYPTFSIVQTPFYSGGMEFSSLIFIADDIKDVQTTVIHETAHQWWYGMVGSDSINESYLDEGLTTFVTAYFFMLNDDAERYSAEIATSVDAYMLYEKLQKMRKTNNTLVMNKSLYDYTAYQYNMLAYNKGCMMFMSLYDTMGKDKFNKALSLYLYNNKYKIANTESLCRAFSAAGKSEYAGFINGWLGDNVLATFA